MQKSTRFVLPFLVASLFVGLFLVKTPLTAKAAVISQSQNPLSAKTPLIAKVATSQPQNPHPMYARGQITPQVSSSNLLYNGGPVMAGTAHVYAIFWENTSGAISAGYQNLINQYFQDVGNSPLYGVLAEYSQLSGGYPQNAVLSGSVLDDSTYPETTLFANDIQGEVTNMMNAIGWTASINNVFFVFTQPGTDVCINNTTSCASNSTCAYHGFFGTNTLYAAIPYLDGLNSRCSPAGKLSSNAAYWAINIASHEQMEAASDPLLNAWCDSSGCSNGEIGDKCDFVFGPTNAAGADVTWNNDSYIVQEEWDNASTRCQLSVGNACPANVSQGSTGTWVQVLQYSLNSLATQGYFTDSPDAYTSPLATDGDFGSQTYAATVDFQFAVGLGSSGGGVAGQRTWSLLGFCEGYHGDIVAPASTGYTNCPPAQSQGSSSIWTQALQDSLNYDFYWGYFTDSPDEFQPYLASDGSFGSLTHAATVDFQFATGLGSSGGGVAGQRTWSLLNRCY